MSGIHRIIDAQPPKPPEGIWVTDTEPFTVYAGPISGSLECTFPDDGEGYAMQTLYRFEQIWATDEPPLEYSYYYTRVPESRRADFMREKARGFGDDGALARLRKLAPGGLSVLSEWTQDPTVEMPLPLGMWMIEGHVRDKHGVNNTRAILVEALTLFDENTHIETIPAAMMVERLEKYINDSMAVILQVRAANKAPMAVVPVCGGINNLPKLCYV